MELGVGLFGREAIMVEDCKGNEMLPVARCQSRLPMIAQVRIHDDSRGSVMMNTSSTTKPPLLPPQKKGPLVERAKTDTLPTSTTLLVQVPGTHFLLLFVSRPLLDIASSATN